MKSKAKILRILERSITKAETKHPTFCHNVSSKTKTAIDSWLEQLRTTNDNAEKSGTSTIEGVAMEELVEFIQAAKKRDAKSAFQEAIDLAVVGLRMAEYALYEI